MGSVAQVKKYRRLASLIALVMSWLGLMQRSAPKIPKIWKIPASKKMIKFRIIEMGALGEKGRGKKGEEEGGGGGGEGVNQWHA